ncbi:MAG: DUF1737 domain-containing protein [Paracoccaceae bacterium]|nr:DUF1737 domain-containing protein [Paracoccaceae bacterium]
MKGYRYITGPDDSEFCSRITRLLNHGWDLAGPATLTFDPGTGRVICGQPMVKDNPDIAYDADMPLDEL